MSKFFIVANACEYTGQPVAGTIEVYITIGDAMEALKASDENDPGQYAQMWCQKDGGGFKATYGVDEGVVYNIYQVYTFNEESLAVGV